MHIGKIHSQRVSIGQRCQRCMDAIVIYALWWCANPLNTSRTNKHVMEKRHYHRWEWWPMTSIPALGRQRQGNFWVRGQPGLQSEFQDSQGYTEKPCLEKQQQQQKKWINKSQISHVMTGTGGIEAWLRASKELQEGAALGKDSICLIGSLTLQPTTCCYSNLSDQRIPQGPQVPQGPNDY